MLVIILITLHCDRNVLNHRMQTDYLFFSSLLKNYVKSIEMSEAENDVCVLSGKGAPAAP